MNLGSRPFASPVCLLSREQGMGGWHLSPHSSVRAFHSKRLGLTRELSHLTLQMPLLGSHLHHHHCHCWHQVPSRVPCLTPTPHTLTARQYFLTGSTPGFPRQSLRHLVPSFQLWHSNTRAQGREGPQQSEPWACLPLQPVHPFLTHPSCFSWSSGGICSGLLWVLQRFWVTATAHTPMAPQLQHHQSVSRETPKKSFQYTPAHLEAKATQSISQLSYASGVFTALHFMAQH